MNSSWLKIAVLVVVVTVIAILVRNFLPSKTQTQSQVEPKSFYEVIEEDDRRLRAEPTPQQPSKQRNPQAEKPTELTGLPQQPAGPQFRELSETGKIEAERLFEMALAQRKMGRLPGVSYKQMVDYCRQIIEKFPDSVYAYKARRMLHDIPQRYRKQYNITDEEMKIDN